MRVLVTGAAGFIGWHLVNKFLLSFPDADILGLDNLNEYYDIQLKFNRLINQGIETDKIEYGIVSPSKNEDKYSFIRADIQDSEVIERLFKEFNFDIICHLAAQAGVRYSLENPKVYLDSNINGFFNILEEARKSNVKQLIYASSSSVYGLNDTVPFSTDHKTDQPVSLYAATKKSNELMAHTFSHLYGLRTTGLRFFTVYGPWGRPDMAYMLFTKSIIEEKPIKVFNDGKLARDFTYIDDITESISRLISNDNSGIKNYDKEITKYAIFNIGSNNPTKLMDFIACIEKELGKEAIKEYLPMQKGDVYSTYADVSPLFKQTDFVPRTKLKDGIREFIKWYKKYYKNFENV